ncbi:neurogenic locus protein delta-like isoform X1 [Crassostrea angulata]|uniref:neurogenic locus protein delta-like isoform X1 n=1 Tax=Magallana angulata TaxID=2784310 RepID=UPI0022B11ABD|nr:neurogenic locus protein delta-like isoform X1 [Crassostrea angulata]
MNIPFACLFSVTLALSGGYSFASEHRVYVTDCDNGECSRNLVCDPEVDRCYCPEGTALGRIDDGDFPFCQVGACEVLSREDVCLPNGVCNARAGFVFQAFCDCNEGYFGPRCNDFCDQHSDCNGGKCIERDDGIKLCQCPPGIEGNQCQGLCEQDSDCNGGTCEEIADQKVCKCLSGVNSYLCQGTSTTTVKYNPRLRLLAAVGGGVGALLLIAALGASSLSPSAF